MSVKDAFHWYLINGECDAVNPAGKGTKPGAFDRFDIVSAGGARRSF